MKKIIPIILLIMSVVLFSCKKETEPKSSSQPTFTKDKINGSSQKGPFVNGSSLTIFELSANYTQTGKSFNTQILDNLGSFEINNLNLLTHFAKLKADGFYFNEISNTNSSAPISLYALSDLSAKSTVNINLLSTLEVSRIEYLLSKGMVFNDAKKQAQKEVLNIFFIKKSDIRESELLDISKDGDDNAILLAASLILQGYRSESELSQLLGDISTDIRTDGILNSSTLGSYLINDAKLLKPSIIRNNIENKYISLGVTVVISDFEKYITQFIDSTKYTFTNFVTFPSNGIYGTNLLNTTDTVFPLGDYSFTANLPKGASLKIIQNGNKLLGYNLGSLNGWTDMGPDTTYVWRTYVSNTTGTLDFHAVINNKQFGDTFTLWFYENGSLTPTRIKNIYIQ